MRSRERLIEVLETVNRSVVGLDVFLASLCAATDLDLLGRLSPSTTLRVENMKGHASPHIRDLAYDIMEHHRRDLRAESRPGRASVLRKARTARRGSETE